MPDKKDAQQEFSTCFERLPFAGMMQKMLGRRGLGSLSAEMMEKIIGRQENGCSFRCAEMMREIIKQHRGQMEQEENKE